MEYEQEKPEREETTPGEQGETTAAPAATRRGETEARPIAAQPGLEPPARQKQANAKGVSGILPRAAKGPQGPEDQAETEGSGSGHAANGSVTAPEDPKERQARYRALVGGEFKDLYTADVQRIIDQRFKETRSLKETVEAQKPVVERLMERFGIQGGDLRALSQALEDDERARSERREAQARQERLDRERWQREAREAQADYPELQLEREEENPLFLAALRSGASVRQAYEAAHLDAVKERVARQAAQAREWALTEHIRARGARPPENGASAQNGLRSGTDVERMTKEERAEAARRAMHGERITFR